GSSAGRSRVDRAHGVRSVGRPWSRGVESSRQRRVRVAVSGGRHFRGTARYGTDGHASRPFLSHRSGHGSRALTPAGGGGGGGNRLAHGPRGSGPLVLDRRPFFN